MSIFAVEKLLHQLSTKPAWEAFLQDVEGQLRGRDITADERAALLNHDVRWLYEHGLNEYLLLRYAGWVGLGRQLPTVLAGATHGSAGTAPLAAAGAR